MSKLQPSLCLNYLGHNAWYVLAAKRGLLIDPLLLPVFGNSPVQPFQVHPNAPAVTPEHLLCSDVLLTHEHSDHVHLGSLKLLPPRSNVYVGPVFPAYLEDAIESLGHIVHRCDYRVRFDINGVSVCLYPCDPATAFWEQRVSQPLLSAASDFSTSIFMAVDALISLEYLAEVERNLVPPPSAIALSNNAYIMPPGKFGPLDSIGSGSGPRGITGLDLIFELTTLPPPLDQSQPSIIIGGGGIRRFDETLYWPFCDQQEVSRLGRVLAPELPYLAPRPGDSIWVHDGGALIEAQADRVVQVLAPAIIPPARPPVFEAVITPQTSKRSRRDCIALVESELPRLAIALGMSALLEYWWQSEQNSDFATILVFLPDESSSGGDVGPTAFGFDALDGCFSQMQAAELSTFVGRAPFGLICYLQDFAAITAGDVEIWDVAGKGIKCWHPPRYTLTNLASFLYAYFGEQVRPDLAASCLARVT